MQLLRAAGQAGFGQLSPFLQGVSYEKSNTAPGWVSVRSEPSCDEPELPPKAEEESLTPQTHSLKLPLGLRLGIPSRSQFR